MRGKLKLLKYVNKETKEEDMVIMPNNERELDSVRRGKIKIREKTLGERDKLKLP